ncbi:MAG: SRPBCC family protein [Pseudomonadota bacterium]
MPVYSTAVAVPHRREDMFDLVSDIKRYPDFIRWIQTMSVSGMRQEGEVMKCLGAARIGFRGFSERFSTNVTADKNAWTVRADLVRGPFRRLRNDWAFDTLEDGGTRINFHIDYEFSNFVLRMMASNNVDLAVSKIMSAFKAEADRRYG